MNIVLARDGFARILNIKTTNKCSCQTKFSYNSTNSVLCPSPIGLTDKAMTWLSMETRRKQFRYVLVYHIIYTIITYKCIVIFSFFKHPFSVVWSGCIINHLILIDHSYYSVLTIFIYIYI